MATIIVDGISYEVDEGQNLLQACLSQGLNLPYFCWHPSMGSVGACRQCAVKQYRNEEDKVGTIVMSCMTAVADGQRISIRDSQAVNFRGNVIESLMINHPHDCPVCEEGGECHLQDMTQMSGHNYRRHDFLKRTHRNQNLGPFINHEMNRCIACYRCVRFYDDYAGGTDLAALGSHHHVYFGRKEAGTLENEFSGNLVEVCPTGVFTDKVFSSHYTRKWDLQTAPSICSGCGVGCNITPGEREGSLRRIVNRYHRDLNGYFICDRGRFGHGYTTSPERIVKASLLSSHAEEKGQRKSLEPAEAMLQLNAMLSGDVIGIGSPRASLESNLALRRRVGAENFYVGYSDQQGECMRQVLSALREPGLQCPDVRSLELADCVLVVNEDLTNTSPRMALAIRQATRNEGLRRARAAKIPLWQDAAVRELAQGARSPLFILAPQGTRLDDVAVETCLLSQEGQMQMLADINACLHSATVSDSDSDAALIAAALLHSERPVIVSGISSGSAQLVCATADLARSLRDVRLQADASGNEVGLCFAMPEANTMAMALLMEHGAGSLGDALQCMAAGDCDAAVVIENDLFLRASTAEVDAAVAKTSELVALDLLENSFNARAHLRLPVSSFAEQNGTWINYEGRAQSAWQVLLPSASCRSSGEWLTSVDALTPQPFDGEQLLADSAEQWPSLAGLTQLHAVRSHLFDTMKAPRQLPRYSGRTALKAGINVHEGKSTVDRQSHLAFSMEGIPLQKDATFLSAAWAPGWNSNQAISKFQDEINGELRQGCPGVHLITRENEGSPVAGVVSAQPNKPSGSDALRVYLIDHIFGGEELSARSVPIRARSSGAYLSIGRDDADRLGLKQHGMAQLVSGACRLRLPVLIRSRIAEGCVGIYCGSEVNRASLAAWATVRNVPQDDNVLVRSRQMFADLIISDVLPGRAM